MVDRALLEAHRRGEIARRDIEDRTDQTVGFGTLLGLLHQHGRPLRRFPSNPRSPGVQLIRRLAGRAVPRQQ